MLEVSRGFWGAGADDEVELKDDKDVVSLSDSRPRLVPRPLPLSLALYLPLPFPTMKALPPRGAFSVGMPPNWSRRNVVRDVRVRVPRGLAVVQVVM